MSRPFCCPNQTVRQSTLLPIFAHQGPELDSAVLSAPAYTKETNPTTGDHHAEQNTRRRTVHRRKHRGRTESNPSGNPGCPASGTSKPFGVRRPESALLPPYGRHLPGARVKRLQDTDSSSTLSLSTQIATSTGRKSNNPPKRPGSRLSRAQLNTLKPHPVIPIVTGSLTRPTTPIHCGRQHDERPAKPNVPRPPTATTSVQPDHALPIAHPPSDAGEHPENTSMRGAPGP